MSVIVLHIAHGSGGVVNDNQVEAAVEQSVLQAGGRLRCGQMWSD